MTADSPTGAVGRETLAYVACSRVGTGVEGPEFLAVVELHPDSDALGRVVHRTPLPGTGDGLHHVGWPAAPAGSAGTLGGRLVLPGLFSSRLFILNLGADPLRPEVEAVLEPGVLARRAGYSRPYRVRDLPGGVVGVGMLADRSGEGPGGLAVLDGRTLEVLGRWEEGAPTGPVHDFWPDPVLGVLLIAPWAAPRAFDRGLRAQDLRAGLYGRGIELWDLSGRRRLQTLAAGADFIPMTLCGVGEGRGFVSAGPGRGLAAWGREGDEPVLRRVADHDGGEAPAGVSDLALAAEGRALYVSDWLRGDIRRFALTERGAELDGVWPAGGDGAGPLRIQVSADGARLYATDGFHPAWESGRPVAGRLRRFDLAGQGTEGGGGLRAEPLGPDGQPVRAGGFRLSPPSN